MTTIPSQLRGKGFRFILLSKKAKTPFEKGWQKDANYSDDDPKLLHHLEEGGNYGILCDAGYLRVLDVDEPDRMEYVLASLPETFTVKTGSGGYHLYFICPDLSKKLVLKDEQGHVGELQGPSSQVVGPGSVHPNGNIYEVVNSAPVSVISSADLLDILRPFTQTAKTSMDKLEDIEKQARKAKARKMKAETDPFAGVAITDVIDVSGWQKDGDQYFGSHPIHGSETGHNLVVNPLKNTWWCGRHETGGGPSLWLAVEMGLLDCAQVRPGALRGDAFIQVLEEAQARGLVESDHQKTRRRQRTEKKTAPDPPLDLEEYTPEIEARAEHIIKEGDPIGFILGVLAKYHAGNQQSAELLLCSLAIGSCLNTNGTQPKMSGGSGKGKSELCRALRHLMPPEWIITTSLSPKALFYNEIKPGTVIFSDDVEIGSDMEGIIKRAMSFFQEGAEHLTVLDKQGARLCLAPRLVWWLTSVSDDQEEQLLNRFFPVGVDESKDADLGALKVTVAPLAEGRIKWPITDDVLTCRTIIRKIKEQTWIVSAPWLYDENGDLAIEWENPEERRNPGRFTDLIAAYAILNHGQRPTEPTDDGPTLITASLEDFGAAKKLYESRAENLTTKLTDNDLHFLRWLHGQSGGLLYDFTTNDIAKRYVGRNGRGVSPKTIERALVGRPDRNSYGLLDKTRAGILTVEKIASSERTEDGTRTTTTTRRIFTFDPSKFDALGSYSDVVRFKNQPNTNQQQEPRRPEKTREDPPHGSAPADPPDSDKRERERENTQKTQKEGTLNGDVGTVGPIERTHLGYSGYSGSNREPDSGPLWVRPGSSRGSSADPKEFSDTSEPSTILEVLSLEGRKVGGLNFKEATRLCGGNQTKAKFYLGTLEKQGWTKEKLTSGLVVLRPPDEEGEEKGQEVS